MKRTAANARDKKISSPPGKLAARRPDQMAAPGLLIANRQKCVQVDTRLLRAILRQLISELPGVKRCELGIQLVGAEEMTSINETFLRHAGSTDVISFDHRQTPSDALIYGELFICTEEAVRQAKRYRTSWQEELVRYLAHGILHLRGFDDRTPELRRRMKREENRLFRGLRKSFPLRNLQRAVNSAHD